MEDATAWMYRGIIYLNIYINEDFKHLDDEALEKALISLNKAMELDEKDRLDKKPKSCLVLKPSVSCILKKPYRPLTIRISVLLQACL